MKHDLPCVLTIAGSDSSGGAGIQADIKSISANGCYAASVITAVTAQNTLGVQAIYPVPAEFVGAQCKSVFSDLNIQAVKIGMLFQAETIAVVRDVLIEYRPTIVVLDPVMFAKNQCELLIPHAVEAMAEMLFPLATLITPNLPEAEVLLQASISDALSVEKAAKQLAEKYRASVLIKGGHSLDQENSNDYLYDVIRRSGTWFKVPRITTRNTHGTGCTYASAISAFLARGFELQDAIQNSKDYLTKAILAGSVLAIGSGCGPVYHYF